MGPDCSGSVVEVEMKTQEVLAIDGPKAALKAIGDMISVILGDPISARELNGKTLRLKGIQVTREGVTVKREYLLEQTHDCTGRDTKSALPEPERLLVQA